jgi:hypothetical protein
MKIKIPWQLWTGGLLLAIGLAVGALNLHSLNMGLTILAMLFLGGGGWLFYTGWRKKGDYAEVRVGKMSGNGHKGNGKTDLQIPNTLIVRPHSVDLEYLDPDYAEDLPVSAMLRKVQKTNKQFYLLEQRSGLEQNELHELVLPDDSITEIHYLPKEFGNVVTMPCTKKYFEWSATTFQKIAIGLMVLVIVAEIIALVIFNGGGNVG